MLIKIDASNLNELSKKMRRCVEDVSDINSAIKSRKQNMPSFIRSEYSIGIQLSDVSKDMDAIDEQIRYLSRVLDQLVADAEILLGNETQALAVDKDKQSNPGFWEGLWNQGVQIVTGIGEFAGGAVDFGADIVRGAGEFGYKALNVAGEYFNKACEFGKDVLDGFLLWDQKLFEGVNGFIGEIGDYFVTNIGQHLDEVGLILSSAISGGEALVKLSTGDLAGFFDCSAKAGYRFTAVFVSGKDREEMLSKGGEDLFRMYFGDAGAAFYNNLDDVPTPGEIIFSGSGLDKKIAELMFDVGDFFADGDIENLVQNAAEVIYPPTKEIRNIFNKVEDLFD